MRKTFFYIGCILIAANLSSCSSFRDNWDKFDDAWERVLWFIFDVKSKKSDVEELREEGQDLLNGEDEQKQINGRPAYGYPSRDKWYERHIFGKDKFSIDRIQYYFEYDTLEGIRAPVPKKEMNEQLTASINVPDSLRNLKENYQVFGWHPHWMRSSYKVYPYNLLSHISFFSYDINYKTGKPDSYRSINQWKDFLRWTKSDSVSAQNSNLKTLLTVSLLGDSDSVIAKFLDNTSKWDTLTKQLEKILVVDSLVRADGICLNVETVPAYSKQKFQEFTKKLYNDLKISSVYGGRDFIFSLALPAVDPNGIFDEELLSQKEFSKGQFIIMGYDFHINNADPRPRYIAPVREIKNSVREYKFHLRNSDSKKLLLAVPYYGAKWTKPIPNPDRGSEVNKEPRYSRPKSWAYNKILELLANHPNNVRTSSANGVRAYYIDTVKNEEVFLRYEDSTTLERKYDLIVDEEIGGIGLWVLGYAGNSPSMWNLLYNKLGKATSSDEPNPLFTEALATHQIALLAIGIFILLGLLAGFIISLFHWKVREALFVEKRLVISYFIAFLVIASIITTLQPVEILRPKASMLLGLLLGIATTYSINYMVNRGNKDTES